MSGKRRLKPTLQTKVRATKSQDAPVGFGNRLVVDTGLATPHESAFCELPQLVPIAAKPVPAVVVPFVLEANSHTIVPKTPELFLEPVVELSVPLAAQKLDDRDSTRE